MNFHIMSPLIIWTYFSCRNMFYAFTETIIELKMASIGEENFPCPAVLIYTGWFEIMILVKGASNNYYSNEKKSKEMWPYPTKSTIIHPLKPLKIMYAWVMDNKTASFEIIIYEYIYCSNAGRHKPGSWRFYPSVVHLWLFLDLAMTAWFALHRFCPLCCQNGYWVHYVDEEVRPSKCRLPGPACLN